MSELTDHIMTRQQAEEEMASISMQDILDQYEKRLEKQGL